MCRIEKVNRVYADVALYSENGEKFVDCGSFPYICKKYGYTVESLVSKLSRHIEGKGYQAFVIDEEIDDKFEFFNYIAEFYSFYSGVETLDIIEKNRAFAALKVENGSISDISKKYDFDEKFLIDFLSNHQDALAQQVTLF